MSELKLIQMTQSLYAGDLDYIVSQLESDETGFWARTYLKTAVSFFEVSLHQLKTELVEYCEEKNIILKPQVAIFLSDKKYELKANGEFSERYHQPNLKVDIKFVFEQFRILKGYNVRNSYASNGWANISNTVKIRNRITHPKVYEEQTITDQEIEACKSGLEWFFENILSFVQQDIKILKKENKVLKNKLQET